MRVLLVEDDELLGSGICDALERTRYTVEWVRDGAQALEALRGSGVDLAVLDLGLPRMDGMEVLRRAREAGVTTPVLVLSARDTTLQRIGGLDAGADDYLTKPFDLDELMARIRVLERRTRGAVVNVIRHGDIEVDTSAMTVSVEGRNVDLQRREYMVLRKLLENIGHVLSRQQLVDNIYGWDSELESNALDVHIHNLRRKLHPGLIRTVRGVGYVIDPLPAAARSDS
ncbi:response regulator transcription factor [Methyloversatilis sp.]|uniref:response regulator n=1 Tax=Methyloversatilis sp. TaxID=2569862 RepID=UPI002736A100|nr:response regulator transcription factor [Methyloversatilis sp.]MDP2870567.1 response regulator transcription factor [Methyloversatilis sp.]MDP3457576.1 response regulator transcription factor [Methyloversatilis sp.]MDP3578418.1 response regulator transcription factor [Methyloversatilis sp.]